MSTIDKIQINSTTYDVAVDAGNVAYSDAATYPDGSAGKEISQLKSEIAPLPVDELFVNETLNYINYGYDTPFHATGVPGASDSTVFTIDRNHQIVEISGGPLSSNAVRVKLDGTVTRTSSSTTVKTFTPTVRLLANHVYRYTIRLLSGTASTTSSYPFDASLYLGGTNSSVGTSVVTDTAAVRTFVGDGELYSACLYISANTTLTNAKFLCTLEDLTARGNEDFDYFDATINGLHGFVNYGYGNVREKLQANPGSSGGDAVAISRYGTRIILNYDGPTTNAKRVVISGRLQRYAGSSTYKNVAGNLTLQEGKEYILRLEKLSGTATDNSSAYMPSVNAYLTGGTAIANEIYSDDKVREWSFTATSAAIWIGIYITSTADLVDFECNVTLTEKVSGTVADYYIAEMADTIEKVRNETTSPSLVFMWSTDNHRLSSNANGVQNFGAMIGNMTEFSSNVPCDFVLDTGDLTDGDTVQATTFSRAYDCMTMFRSIGVPFVWSMGNHDTNYAVSGQSYIFNLAQCFKAYFTSTKVTAYNASENGTDYYIDFDALNTRLICLNANNRSAAIEYAYGSTTAAWLEDALDTDKNVILAVHQSPIRDQVYNRQSTDGATAIVEKLQAFVSGGGNLIMVSGHSHNDVAFVDPWLSVMIDCQRFSNVATDVTDEAHDMSGYIDVVRKNARAQYTATEDLWEVCVYKPDTNEFSMIRFGAGLDRYFHVTPIAPSTVTTKLTGTVTWSSSDTDVATVADGVITGAATGRCAVLAKDEAGNYEAWIVDVT